MTGVPIGMTGRELEQTLLSTGWYQFHSRGGHYFYRHPNRPGRQLTIPMFFAETIPNRALRAIIEEAALSGMDL